MEYVLHRYSAFQDSCSQVSSDAAAVVVEDFTIKNLSFCVQQKLADFVVLLRRSIDQSGFASLLHHVDLRSSSDASTVCV